MVTIARIEMILERKFYYSVLCMEHIAGLPLGAEMCRYPRRDRRLDLPRQRNRAAEETLKISLLHVKIRYGVLMYFVLRA